MCLVLNQGASPAAQLALPYRPRATECKCSTASVPIAAVICRAGALWSRRRHQLSKHEPGGCSENSSRPWKRIRGEGQAGELSDEQAGEAGGTFGSYSGNTVYNGAMQRAAVGKISRYPRAVFLGL